MLKSFKTLVNAKTAQTKVSDGLGHLSRDSEIISSFILEVLLRLA